MFPGGRAHMLFGVINRDVQSLSSVETLQVVCKALHVGLITGIWRHEPLMCGGCDLLFRAETKGWRKRHASATRRSPASARHLHAVRINWATKMQAIVNPRLFLGCKRQVQSLAVSACDAEQA